MDDAWCPTLAAASIASGNASRLSASHVQSAEQMLAVERKHRDVPIVRFVRSSYDTTRIRSRPRSRSTRTYKATAPPTADAEPPGAAVERGQGGVAPPLKRKAA